MGLLETFKIPTPEFLLYFHALELGYRDKPCELIQVHLLLPLIGPLSHISPLFVQFVLCIYATQFVHTPPSYISHTIPNFRGGHAIYAWVINHPRQNWGVEKKSLQHFCRQEINKPTLTLTLFHALFHNFG